MKIKINDDTFKRIWIELLVKYGLNIDLTNKEYEVLEQCCKYPEIGTRERREIKNTLNVSAQVITNNLHKLKDKKLLKFDKENSKFVCALTKHVPRNISQLNKVKIEFVTEQLEVK